MLCAAQPAAAGGAEPWLCCGTESEHFKTFYFFMALLRALGLRTMPGQSFAIPKAGSDFYFPL